jgi:hypothetical protein
MSDPLADGSPELLQVVKNPPESGSFDPITKGFGIVARDRDYPVRFVSL